LTKLLLERRLPLLDELLHERHPNRALGLRERPRTRLGAAAHAHDVEFALVLHHLGKHVLLRIDLEHGFAKRLGNAWIRPAGVTGRADDAEIPGELDGQRAELLRGLRPRALADELAPVGRAHRARLFEQRHGFGARSDRDVRNAAPLRLVEVGPVLLVVLANVGLWQVVRARDVLPDLLEQLVPQGLAEPLFGLRQLVEAAPARFLGQELDVDHLLEEQAPSLGRLVAKPLERIHALERRDVVTERDGPVPDSGEHLLLLLGAQLERSGARRGRCARRGLLLRFRLLAGHAEAERDENQKTRPSDGGLTRAGSSGHGPGSYYEEGPPPSSRAA